jgi:hypothetical protein
MSDNQPKHAREWVSDRTVLLMISLGLIIIIFSVIAGLFGWFESKVNQPLPNWAENVLVAIVTAAVLKLGDCLSTLLALSSGRQVERLGNQLANTLPTDGTPLPVVVENKPEHAVPVEESQP